MTPQLNLEEVEQWMYMLHGDCPGFSVVSAPGNWSGYAVDVNSDNWPGKLIDYVAKLDAQQVHSLYLRVTTVSSEPDRYRRGSTSDSVALPALWLDMDIAGPGHKPIKPTPRQPKPLPLPPDEDTCQEILSASGVPEPTCWVHSGGGLYPWWFFREPVKLLGTDEIEQWEDHSRNLHERVHATAREMGFHYGLGTHDLARVMRIPGTVNRKVADDPKQARFWWPDRGGNTFFPDELGFQPVVVDEPTPAVMRETVTVSSAPAPASSSSSSSSIQAVRPGDDYNARGDVLHDVLLPEGWEVHSMRGGELLLTRPGKDRRDGHSASLGYQGSSNLYVWSSDAGLDVQEPLSPFYLFTHYRHGGDFKAASRELGSLGYGDPLEKLTSNSYTSAGMDLATIVGEPSQGTEQITIPAEPAGADGTPPDNQDPTVVQGDDADPRPWVDMTNPTETCVDLVTLIGLPGTTTESLFLLNGEIMYIPACDTVFREGFGTNPTLMNVGSFKVFMSQRMRYTRYRDDKWGPAQPTTDFFSAIFSSLKKGCGNLRIIAGIESRPIVRSDGTVCDVAGYDPVTRKVYCPDPTLSIPAIPVDPTPAQVMEARSIIETMICDFPFISTNHRNNYIGFLLTPMLFNVTNSSIKMGVIGAHQSGSGKTLLNEILHLIYGGEPMSAPKQTQHSDEELKKQITAALRNDGETVCSWDNVSGDLDSTVLDKLLTSRTWKERLLGVSSTISLPNDRLWITTGNNVKIGSDLTRRVTWSVIDAGMPHPEERNNFRIPNLKRWVGENKSTILWALYTLIQAWTRKGQPTWCRKSDLFCEWVGMINGILKVSGWEGTFDADDTKQQTQSTQTDLWEEFCETVHGRFGSGEWTLKEIINLTAHNGVESQFKPFSADILPMDVIKDMAQGDFIMAARRLGLYLTRLVNSFQGPFQLKKNPQRTRMGHMWSIHPAKAFNPGDSAPKVTEPPVELSAWPLARPVRQDHSVPSETAPNTPEGLPQEPPPTPPTPGSRVQWESVGMERPSVRRASVLQASPSSPVPTAQPGDPEPHAPSPEPADDSSAELSDAGQPDAPTPPGND